MYRFEHNVFNSYFVCIITDLCLQFSRLLGFIEERVNSYLCLNDVILKYCINVRDFIQSRVTFVIALLIVNFVLNLIRRYNARH